MKTIAIIPAGGKGVRSGLSAPKQYLKFYGKELIAYTIDVFQKNILIDEIIIAAEKKYHPLLEKLRKKYRFTKIKKIVEGGNERQDSVNNALQSAGADKDDLIVVHDAARPLIPQEVLSIAINTAVVKGNALVCSKSKDTVVKGTITVESYLNRDEIYNVQTPQIFKYKDLKKAMEKAYSQKFTGTDESILIKRMGKKIYIVEGSLLNFKVTTRTDLIMLKRILSGKYSKK